MQDNPYAAIVNMFRDDTDERLPVSFRTGTVNGSSPISIDIGGALQEGSALVFTTENPYFERGQKVLLIPMEEEQRYIVLTRLVGL